MPSALNLSEAIPSGILYPLPPPVGVRGLTTEDVLKVRNNLLILSLVPLCTVSIRKAASTPNFLKFNSKRRPELVTVGLGVT